MLRFYTKEKISKEVHTINLSRAEAELILEGNLFKDCPQYNDGNVVIIERDTEMAFPIWDGVELREMTREEQIKDLGMENLLLDGEYLSEGEIVVVEKPLNLIRPAWNRETHEWYETMTKEELLEKRATKILEYSKLENEKNVLESSKFSTTEEIQLITEKMAELESEINQLAEQIEIL